MHVFELATDLPPLESGARTRPPSSRGAAGALDDILVSIDEVAAKARPAPRRCHKQDRRMRPRLAPGQRVLDTATRLQIFSANSWNFCGGWPSAGSGNNVAQMRRRVDRPSALWPSSVIVHF